MQIEAHTIYLFVLPSSVSEQGILLTISNESIIFLMRDNDDGIDAGSIIQSENCKLEGTTKLKRRPV